MSKKIYLLRKLIREEIDSMIVQPNLTNRSVPHTYQLVGDKTPPQFQYGRRKPPETLWKFKLITVWQ